MLLKTYRGSDLAGTLRRIRDELGPDALVLGTSETKKRFGLPVVEVTVAAPRDRDAATGADTGADTGIQRLAEEIRELRSELGREDTSRKPAAPRRPAARSSFCHTTVEQLVSVGLDPDLAERFGRISTQGGAEATARAVSREVASILEFAPLPFRRRCLFVVGPPGAGKTTTVAKIASRVAAAGRDVVFGVADGERIGSFEQAEIYSRYIGSRTMRIDAADDLRTAIDSVGRRGLVVVDTSGISASDERRRSALHTLRQAEPHADVVVLVPGGLHHAEAGRVMDRFSTLEPSCVAWSRTDDSERPGELFTALARRDVPLSFVTTGQTVPHDLETATPEGVAAMLLRPPKTEASA